MAIADGRGDRHIGAEHIMLAVTCAEVDLTARLLAEVGVDVAALRERLSA
ncbi:Clp protease N-terminal domain-containing protein [Mycobacterium rufum]|nr:Clp protease N-terminal domain-containing protein [Mycolicibacterium rufum]